MVLGRHTRCDLVLDDADLALRHLVAHFGAGPVPTVRLWDLRTAQPFVTEDGQESSAVVAEGLLFCTLGPVTLLFVPLDAITFSLGAGTRASVRPASTSPGVAAAR